MARATINGWKSVAVRMALGAGALCGGLPVLAGAGQDIGRTATRASQSHAALNSGIDCYRRADFETAARYFQHAEQGSAELTIDERQELASLLRLNGAALKARQEAASLIRQAEGAAKTGHNAEAEALLKSVAANQFVSPNDRERAAVLAEQLGVGALIVRGQEDKFIHPLLARGKLQQARQLMAKGNYESAEAVAHEAEKLNATYHNGEDTPRKVLDDIARVMSDPKKLLVAARIAFQGGDLDQAEKLAQAAQNASGPKMAAGQFFGDNPSKVIKDVHTVRARLAKANRKSAEPTKVANAAPPKSEKVPNEAPSKPEKVASAEAPTPENARELVKQGRSALKRGDVDGAQQYLDNATAQNATFRWWEDSPTKLAADIRRVADRRGKNVNQDAVASKSESPEATTMPALSAPAASDALAMLRDARELFAAGHLEEAEQRAQQALSAGKTDWGLFDDSPEKVLLDIRKAHLMAERENAVQLLAGARRLYEKGDLDAALILAQRAEKMYGAAGLWDTGDRPALLLTEIGAAQARAGTPGAAVVNASHSVGSQPAEQLPDRPMPPTVPANVPPAQVSPMPDATKQQAQQLLADARQLQKENRLVEARMKSLDAQKLGAAFARDEDQPERALLQLADIANKRIEQLQQAATDLAATAQTDAQRYQMAEGLLLEARQLAAGYALDMQPIEAKLNWVHRTRDQAMAPAPTEQAPNAQAPTLPAATAPAAATHPGQELLDKARLELKGGDLETARRFAVEVYNGPFGLKAEADAVLHSIDAEEFNRKIHAAHRTFEVGVNAYVSKNYAQAAIVLRSVDVGLLPPDKQAKLKELLSVPEMQPGAVAQIATPAAPQVVAEPAKLAPAEAAPVKGSDASYAMQVQAMQEIQFQKLRDEGLKAQRDASDRFRNGDTVQALDILQDYLRTLKETDLDPERLALLQRPAESRLQGFKKLKAQDDFEKERTGSQYAVQNLMQREAQLEAHKKQQVDELMKKYHQCFGEGKYADAEMAATQAHELDPDNAAAAAAVHIAKMQRNSTEYKKLKGRKEDMFVGVLNDAEEMGPTVTSKDPLKYDDERWAMIKGRKQFPKDGWSLITKSEKELEIERKLSLPISLDFKDQSLKHVLEDLRDMTGINIVPDMPALEAENISLDRPITMHLEGVMTKSALNLILHHAKLIYVIKDEVLLVTTEAHARGKLVARSYQVTDLVIPVENHPLATTLNQQVDRVNNQQGMQGLTTPYLGGNTLRTGTNVSGTGTGSPAGATFTSEKNAASSAPLQETLIKLITTTIKPESWSEMGGPGTIEFWPLTMALVVNQTPDIQEQVAELLAALRRLQDVEVAVEVRFISLSEAFYERIGLDFNVNVMTRNTKYEPLIVANQFQQNGFNNTFRPSNFVTGLVPGGQTPPGAFTHDLNIPIINSSFTPAIPPFGGFPNSLGLDGGLSLGLAFLSDIQVFMFMEAAQADRRTNVMQAPKLTLFNGQTSNITINTQQFFVTNIQAYQINGQVIYAPQNNAFPLGVQLAIQAVISADRRYVRLNINPNLTNLASPVTALFPITAFITPVFDNGVQGQPIPFTQYVQQPTFQSISINTTVLVPDGGTVIMGGLKTLREGRNEFGPPILSKLPYVNRLFKNVGYGKETESLLIMVTPRIIINEEEEDKLGTGQGRVLPSGGVDDFIRRGAPALLDRGAGADR